MALNDGGQPDFNSGLILYIHVLGGKECRLPTFKKTTIIFWGIYCGFVIDNQQGIVSECHEPHYTTTLVFYL